MAFLKARPVCVATAAMRRIRDVRKGACGGPGQNQIECHDSLGHGGESLTWMAPPDTEYWIFVDGAGNQSGNFELEITVDPS